MPDPSFVSLPPHWINRAAFTFRSQLQRAFAGDGIDVTPEEWAVQMVLREREPLSVGDLASLSLRDRTTVTRVLEGLDRKGLIARRADSIDRRRTLICLTSKGHALFPRMRAHVEALIVRSVRGIDSGAIAIMVTVLEQMVANLAEKEG